MRVKKSKVCDEMSPAALHMAELRPRMMKLMRIMPHGRNLASTCMMKTYAFAYGFSWANVWTKARMRAWELLVMNRR